MLAVPLEFLGSSPGSVAVGRDRGRRTTGPASSGLGEGLAGKNVLVPSRTSDSCGGPGTVHSDMVTRCTVFPLTHWCRLSEHCVKKQCGLGGLCFGGRLALDLHLFRVRMGVAAMRQDCNYQLDTTKLGRKRGKSFTKIKINKDKHKIL